MRLWTTVTQGNAGYRKGWQGCCDLHAAGRTWHRTDEQIAAYKLQEEGYDTVDANTHLGFKPDERDYGCGAQMLRHLGVHKMRLLTNNPVKRVGLEAYGLEIVENVPIEVTPNKYNERYLRTKEIAWGIRCI